MTTVGKRIQAIRHALEMTQEEFIKPLEIKQSTLNKIESGKDKPSNTLLLLIYEKYLKKYDINKEWLLCGKEGTK